MVMAINKGAEINVFGVTITPSPQLPETLKNYKNELHRSQRQNAELKKKIGLLKNDILRLSQIAAREDDRFLNRVLRLQSEINKWDGSINTTVSVSEKTEIFRIVQHLLKRIGQYHGDVNADPTATQTALATYKKNKGFTDPDLFTYITHQTIIFIVRDYAELLLKEAKG